MKRLKTLGAAIVGVAAVLGTIFTIYNPFSDDRDRDHPSTGFSFTDPVPSQVPDKPCRFVARGTGLPPDGKDLAVADQEEGGGGRLYFESDVQKDDQRDEWAVTLVIGDDATPRGTLFHLYAVLMDSDLESYLATVTDDTGATWWSSPRFPPGAKTVATAEVRWAKKNC